MDAPQELDPNVRRVLEEMEAELSALQAKQDSEELARIEASSGGSSVIDRTVRSTAAGIARAGFETYDFMFGEPDHQDKTGFRRSVEAQDRALDRQSFGYGMVSGVSQFVTGMVGAGKLLAPVKAVQTLRTTGKAGRLTYEVGRGAIAGATVLDPHEERLSNLIETYPALENPLTDYLAADLTDSAAEGRLKNALEGIGLDLAVIGIFATSLRALKLAKGGDSEGARAALSEIEQAPQAANQNVQGSAAPTPAEAEAAGAAPSRATIPEAANQNNAARTLSADNQNIGVSPGNEALDVETPSTYRTTGEAGNIGDSTGLVPEAANQNRGVRPAANQNIQPEPAVDAGEVAKRTEAANQNVAPATIRGVAEEAPTEARGAASVSDGPEVATKANPSPTAIVESTEAISARSDPAAPPPVRVQAESETVEAILKATETDAAALRAYGSREAAVEAGHRFADGAKLPWQKLIGTAEVRAFVDNAADALKQQLDARKGGDILSDDRVRAMVLHRAALFNEEPALVMGQLAKAGQDASRMVADMEASYLIANRMLQDTYDTAFKVRNGMLAEWRGDMEAATRDLKARISASADLLAAAKSISSNSGRALRRMRREFHIRPEDMAKLRELDGTQIAEIIYQTKGDPKLLAQAVNPNLFRRAIEEATFSLTNSLLWLYPTHVVNITSNLYMLAARPTEKAIGSIAQGKAGSAIRQRAIREYLYTVTALSDAWSVAVEAFKRGDGILSPHATEYFGADAARSQSLPWKPVASVWDLLHNAILSANYRTIVGLPTRALGTADEFMKQLRYRAVVQASAAADGESRGLTGEGLRAYVESRLARAFDAEGRATDSAALREAQTATFQQELIPGTVGATIRNVRAAHPSLTFILPFVKTPINVLRYGWKMTPGLNLLQKEYQQAIAGKAGAEAKAHAVGQMTLGAIFMGLGATMALEGRLTGGGPKDPALLQELSARGWKPYSVVWEGQDGQKRYFPLGRFDPAGMAFGMIADLMNLKTIDEDADITAALGAVILSLSKNFSDRTFLQNINQALRAFSEPETHLEKWAGNVAGNTIPLSSLIRGLNPDPYMREARSFVDSTLKNLPGYSETLPPVRDAFGEPVWRRIGLTTTADEDEVEAEHNRIILETGRGIGKPDPKLADVDLRDITLSTGRNAYDRLQELTARPAQGPTLKEALAKLIRSETYQRLPDGDAGVTGTRLNAMGRVVGAYREAARKALLRESPELRQAVGQRQRQAAAAFLENRRAKSKEPGARELLESLRGGRGL